MMDSISFAAMRVSATQIIEAFKGEIDPVAAERIAAKLLNSLGNTGHGPDNSGARVMLLGALAAVIPDSVLAQIDHDSEIHRPGAGQ